MSHVQQPHVMSPGGQTTATAYTIPFGASNQAAYTTAAPNYTTTATPNYTTTAMPNYINAAPAYDNFMTEMETKYTAPMEVPQQTRAIELTTTSSAASGALLSPNQSGAPRGNSHVIGSTVRDEMEEQDRLMDQDLDSFRLAQRQKTIEYNMRNGVGAVMGSTHVNKQDGSRGIVFDLDGSRAAAEKSSLDHVHIRRLLNATSGYQEEQKPKYRAHHAPGNINNVVRDLALNNKTATRGLKMGTGIQPETNQVSSAIQYELSVARPKGSGVQASGQYGGTGINAAVRNRAVSGGGNLAYGDNIIRDELSKEDNVLHPQRTLEEHRTLTNQETEQFKNRQWSPLR